MLSTSSRRARGNQLQWDGNALTINAHAARASLLSIVRGSFAISTQLTLVICFSLLFSMLHQQLLHATTVLLLSAAFASLAALSVVPRSGGAWEITRGAATLLVLLYVLTPVLASLAKPIADDTIYAASVLLLATHVLLHDYSTGDNKGFQTLTSTNAGLVCTLFLTSRLPRHDQRFCFIFLGLCVFALLPMVVSHVRRHYYHTVYLRMAVVFPVLTALALHVYCARHAPEYSWTVWAFTCAIVTINVVAPIIMYKMQSLKHVMRGQWSEVLLEELDIDHAR